MSDPSAAGAAGDHEPAATGAGNQTQGLSKAAADHLRKCLLQG